MHTILVLFLPRVVCEPLLDTSPSNHFPTVQKEVDFTPSPLREAKMMFALSSFHTLP